MIELSEILTLNGEHINFEHLKRKSFKGVSTDSRIISRGDIYIPVKGEKYDGHDFINNAVEKGASLVFVSEKWIRKNKKKINNIPAIIVKDTVLSLGELSLIHRKRINIPVLFIAGSNGKTTTKDLVAAVLSEKFNVLKNEGNLNNHIGLPISLLKLNYNHTIAVLEAGSNHFGEVKYLCSIGEPDFGLVTNIGKEHLEFFGNLSGVKREEFSLYDYLIRNNKSCCFLNLDDPHIRKYAYKIGDPNMKMSYSYSFDSDIKAVKKGYDNKFRPSFEAFYKNKKISVTVNTFGKHSFENALAALTCGIYFGVSPDKIKYALEQFNSGSSKRMETELFKEIVIINDSYNSNPDSVKIGFETLNDFSVKGKKHVVFGDMLEMGKSGVKEHQNVGLLASKMNFEFLYTYGKNSYHTFAVAKKISNNFYFDNKDDLCAMLLKTVKPGDVIYVKGSRGMEMETVINNFKKNY